MEQNAGVLSYTPTELHKRQIGHADIGPVLQWKESGNRPFEQEICSASAATRHYWNYWDLLEVENGLLMRHFVRVMLWVITCSS